MNIKRIRKSVDIRTKSAAMRMFGKIMRTNPNRVIFKSFKGQSYSDNPKAISEALHAASPETEIVWAFRDSKSKKLPSYIKCVRSDSFSEMKMLASSAVWVDNFGKDSTLTKGNNQLYIQTWHGDKGFKKILHDSTFKQYGELFEEKHCDLMLAGSELICDVYRTAFRYTGEIQKLGCPRNDMLKSPDSLKISNIKNLLGISDTTRIMLYAPTLRRTAQTTRHQQLQKIDLIKTLDTLEKKDRCKYICLVRAHSASGALDGVPASNRIKDVSDYEDMADLLLISDILITDYSSCAGDFVIKNKPVILFQSDREEYLKNDRTFYFDIDSSPYMVAKSQAELEELIEKYTAESVKKNCEEVLKFYGANETGHACDATVKRIISFINKGA